jgi:ribonuclease P protein component
MVSEGQNLIINRMTVRRQFLDVAQGRKAAGRFVLLQARETPSVTNQLPPTVLYGLTASKKVGNAVARNRARRRLRAAMLTLLPIHATAGNAYVAVARSATVTADWSALLEDLSRLFQRVSPPVVS